MILKITWFQRSMLFCCLLLAASSVFLRTQGHASGEIQFSGWPQMYADKPIQAIGLTAREQGFVTQFPGKIERFTDGRREIIIRWVTEPTRRLHPAADCFRSVGFDITPLPAATHPNGAMMSCFLAESGQQSLKVCEWLNDGNRQSWPDVSSWYWSALFNRSSQGWWSYVVAENVADIQ